MVWTPFPGNPKKGLYDEQTEPVLGIWGNHVAWGWDTVDLTGSPGNSCLQNRVFFHFPGFQIMSEGICLTIGAFRAFFPANKTVCFGLKPRKSLNVKISPLNSQIKVQNSNPVNRILLFFTNQSLKCTGWDHSPCILWHVLQCPECVLSDVLVHLTSHLVRSRSWVELV